MLAASGNPANESPRGAAAPGGAAEAEGDPIASAAGVGAGTTVEPGGALWLDLRGLGRARQQGGERGARTADHSHSPDGVDTASPDGAGVPKSGEPSAFHRSFCRRITQFHPGERSTRA